MKYASDPQIVRLLAERMRQLHAIQLEDCPFSRRFRSCGAGQVDAISKLRQYRGIARIIWREHL
ncbi:hypothetical protein B1222_19640 [Paenibacillus larvae subsp. pulvifaciens]|nr:hypothetical protein B1222_19640 [Paenibacillus larvae subsp. pulvifaciens]